MRVPCSRDAPLSNMRHVLAFIPRCTCAIPTLLPGTADIDNTWGQPSVANVVLGRGPLQDIELELRAAWKCLQRCEASYTARLDAAEAAVRETARSAQVRPSSGSPVRAHD